MIHEGEEKRPKCQVQYSTFYLLSVSGPNGGQWSLIEKDANLWFEL